MAQHLQADLARTRGGGLDLWDTAAGAILFAEYTDYVSRGRGSTPDMPNTYVGASEYGQTGSAASSFTPAMDTTLGGTMFVLAAASDAGSEVQTITDNYGNTYSLMSKALRPSNAVTYALYRCVNFTGGAAHVITNTTSTNPNTSALMAVQVVGMTSVDQQDVAVAMTADVATPFPVSVALTGTDDLVLVFSSSTYTSSTHPLDTVRTGTTAASHSLTIARAVNQRSGTRDYAIVVSSSDAVVGAVAIFNQVAPAPGGAAQSIVFICL